MMLVLFLVVLIIGIAIIIARKNDNTIIRHISLIFSIIIILSLASFIWMVIDWPSPHHWIRINPIADTSTQKEGFSEFVLPSGDYVIVVSGASDNIQDSEMEISYVLEIPVLSIHIEEQRKIDIFRGSRLFEKVHIKKDKTKGTLKVRVLVPSKGKASIGLSSNRFAGM